MAKINGDYQIIKAGLDEIANVFPVLPVSGSIARRSKMAYNVRPIHLLADFLSYDWNSERLADVIKQARSSEFLCHYFNFAFSGAGGARSGMGLSRGNRPIAVHIETLH